MPRDNIDPSYHDETSYLAMRTIIREGYDYYYESTQDVPDNITDEQLNIMLSPGNDEYFKQTIPHSTALKEVIHDHPGYQNQLFNKLIQHLDFYLQKHSMEIVKLAQINLTQPQTSTLFNNVIRDYFQQAIPNLHIFERVVDAQPDYQDRLLDKLVQHLDFYIRETETVADVLKLTKFRLTEQQKETVFSHIMSDNVLQYFNDHTFMDVADYQPDYQNQLFDELFQHLDFYVHASVKSIAFFTSISRLTNSNLTEQQKNKLFNYCTLDQDRLDSLLNQPGGLATIFKACSSWDDKQYLFEQVKNKRLLFGDSEADLQALAQLCPNEKEKEQMFQWCLDHIEHTRLLSVIEKLANLGSGFNSLKYQTQLLKYLGAHFDYVVNKNVTIEPEQGQNLTALDYMARQCLPKGITYVGHRARKCLHKGLSQYSYFFKSEDKEKIRANVNDWLMQQHHMPDILSAISVTRNLPPQIAQRINEFAAIPEAITDNYLSSDSQFAKYYRLHKISYIIQEETYNHLQQFINPQTSTDYQVSVQLCDRVEQQGIAVIWPQIEAQVTQRVLEETDCGNQFQDRDSLESTITQVRDLTRLNMDPKKSLSQSKGYQAFCSQTNSANALIQSSYLCGWNNKRKRTDDETLEDTSKMRGVEDTPKMRRV